jgi:hypothetical protein
MKSSYSRFIQGISLRENWEVGKANNPKSQTYDLLDPGGGHVTHQSIHVSKDHVSKDTWHNQMVTSVKV